MEINGKAAVITGAASGIGRCAALQLAERGARVIIADRDEERGRAVVDEIGAAGGIAVFHRCDVTQTEDLANTIASCVDHFGRFDIMCNNAGISGEQLFDDMSGAWTRVIDINLTAVIDGTRIAVREMRRTGGGVIINTASMGGILPIPGGPVYAATKAGVVNFTRSLAGLAAQDNIRVNAICPSYTDTPLVRKNGEDDARIEEIGKLVGGILKPEFVAAGIVEMIEDDTKAGEIMRVTSARGRDYAKEVRPY